jgi:hypothetical protein
MLCFGDFWVIKSFQNSEEIQKKILKKKNIVNKQKAKAVPSILRNFKKKQKNSERKKSKIVVNNNSPKFSELFDNRSIPKSISSQKFRFSNTNQPSKNNFEYKIRKSDLLEQHLMRTKGNLQWMSNLNGKQKNYLKNIKENKKKNRSIRIRKILKNQAIFEASQKKWYKIDHFRAGQ